MWQALGNLIPHSIKKAGIARQVSDALICEEFDIIARSVLGRVAEHCSAVYVKDGMLWVAVLSSPVSGELKLYEQDILRALADKFGEGRITGLRFMT
ncbi:MAG: hypothetical protein COV79_04850 [Parcubacteria group bacterium CG11_big_fil_rev_8_21_14_0_20_41_14]|nr:MAG: hypothetical protein COV79_04850 [Parcubacteria group bacterium CG11_big_fil_rev_8_21_14_0_20_41_14]